jgi:Ca-activated chloride channel family protein
MRAIPRFLRPSLLATVLAVSTVASSGPLVDDLRIGGRVVSERTGAPLPGVQVHVSGTNIGTLTDTDGRYSLVVRRDLLPHDGAHLVVVLLGFRPETVPLPVAPTSDTMTIDVRLGEEHGGLDEVVVTGTTAEGRRAARAALRTVPTSVPTTVPPPAPTSTGATSPVPFSSAERDAAGRRRSPGYAPPVDREQYAHIAENAFQAVRDHPLSTFSIDVDRASYSNVRRFLLRERRLPPVDAVQIEEMINYFAYDHEGPRGDDPVGITAEVGRAPWQPEHRLLRIGLASRPVATEDMPPSNLVFLLDVSGSMSSPDKLPLVKASMRLLVHQLRPVDRVAIVVYAGAAGLVLEPTPGRHKDAILEAIERLEAGGSTAGGAGLRLAYDVARRGFRRGGNNRVILATDGDFNVGESSDAAMIRLVEEKREQGTFLTVLGFGTGNLQSTKMQGLAQHGNGNYAYIDSIDEARKVLVREMGGTLLTVAKDVKVQVEFNPERVRAYRLIGYENRLLATEDFNDDIKDAGELGAGHTVTALYEVVPAGADTDVDLPGVDPLRYQETRPASRRDHGDELVFVRIRYKRPHGTESRLIERPVRDVVGEVSSDFSFAAAVAGFGMLLRESPHRGSISTRQVLALAEEGLGSDPDGARRGFLDLVWAYEALTDEPVTTRAR